MRTSLRAAIAITVALGALVIASTASAQPSSAPPATFIPPLPGPGGGLAVCGVDFPSPDPGQTAPDTPGCIINDTPDPNPGSQPQIVQPTPGMADVRPTAFDTATVGDDDHTVTITFWSGIDPCAVLDHVNVIYGTDAVTITLYQGRDPSAGDVACIEIAVLKQTSITLDEPLAGRAIVDGA
jgi:hypothetical protein